AVAFVSGAVLRLLVRRSAIHPSRALHIIESISVLAGGAVGSVIVLVLLIILWPAAGNWIINTFLSDTLIWQTEFQQWITQKIEDPTTSSAIGLLIQRVQFGSAFLGFVSGWGAKWLLEKVMGKRYHANIHAALQVTRWRTISRHFGSIRANKMAPRDERGAGRTRRKRNLRARRLQNRGRSSFAGRTIDAYVRFRTFLKGGRIVPH